MGTTHLTDVGAYTTSPGPYGTFDQGGLLYQWTDSLMVPSFAGYSGFAMFNSSFLSGSSTQLRSDTRVWPWSPANQFNFMGFRIAKVPITSHWQGITGGTWSTSVNWNHGTPLEAGDTAVIGDLTASGDSFTVILDASQTIGHLVFDLTNCHNYVLTQNPGDIASSLIFDNGPDAASISILGTGFVTIDVPILLAGDLMISADSGAVLTISGSISDFPSDSAIDGLGGLSSSTIDSDNAAFVPEPSSGVILLASAGLLLRRSRRLS
jgi:hypothetical protein